ncbi:MAG: DUF108 domain-containing protein [Candidatus Omnitrophica bacterium]|nr:DUF108 domain-containing protein [Candidatus Omnitrophota bacterium]
MVRIGIVGCGTIGSHLAQTIEQKFSRTARLSYVSDRHPAHIEKLKRKLRLSHPKTVSTSELIRQSDFIIETASVQASQEMIPNVLKLGKEALILSVGGLLKIKGLRQLLAKSRGRIYVPSGAIAGIDAVLAARKGTIKSVCITTRKPLKSLQGSPYFNRYRSRFEKIKKPTCIFKGNAWKAIQNFPENVNVAATLSLAGVGPQKTKVQIFTSPSYRHNQHEIEVEWSLGRISTQVINLPSRENPKTSALAIASAIATLGKIFSNFKVGT